MAKNLESMSIDELKVELKRLKDNLCDIEDLHAFTFGKTSVHIGAEKAQNLTSEYEEECKMFRDRSSRGLRTISATLRTCTHSPSARPPCISAQRRRRI